jgi:hypothetical protein
MLCDAPSSFEARKKRREWSPSPASAGTTCWDDVPNISLTNLWDKSEPLSVICVIEPDVIKPDLHLAQRFRTQSDKWAEETSGLSSPAQKIAHPSYQAILGMAQEDKREIIQLLLVDLRDRRRQWFWALSFLTQDNPISQKDAGKMDKMIAAWVGWGRGKGYL